MRKANTIIYLLSMLLTDYYFRSQCFKNIIWNVGITMWSIGQIADYKSNQQDIEIYIRKSHAMFKQILNSVTFQSEWKHLFYLCPETKLSYVNKVFFNIGPLELQVDVNLTSHVFFLKERRWDSHHFKDVLKVDWQFCFIFHKAFHQIHRHQTLKIILL